MRIEILTRNVEKKPDILTCLRDLRGFDAAGGRVVAEGVEADMDGGYILLTVTLPWLADALIRRLFTVGPVPFAPSFYEITGDPKVIVTCAAKPVNLVIPDLDVIDHLDVEAGELAGRFETGWSSRDIDLAASHEVIIQGGVAVARVKFSTHFRETEQHCRDVLSRASLSRGLAVFSAEAGGLVKPARISPIALTATSQAGEEACADFLNRCPGMIIYLEEEKEYRVKLPGEDNRVILSGKNRNCGEVSVCLESPWSLDGGLFELLGELTGVDRAQVACAITGLTLSPDDLIRRLGFIKEKEFTLFSARLEGLEVRYDISRREMTIRAEIPWSKVSGSGELFGRIGEFTGRVMQFAV
jgi:hypothetical protein